MQRVNMQKQQQAADLHKKKQEADKAKWAKKGPYVSVGCGEVQCSMWSASVLTVALR